MTIWVRLSLCVALGIAVLTLLLGQFPSVAPQLSGKYAPA